MRISSPFSSSFTFVSGGGENEEEQMEEMSPFSVCFENCCSQLERGRGKGERLGVGGGKEEEERKKEEESTGW